MRLSTTAIGLWRVEIPSASGSLPGAATIGRTGFPLVVEAVNHLKVRTCLIDGEVVCCDEQGLARFDVLRRRRNEVDAFLYAFDLLELDGTDLRREPIETRKATLASVLRKSRPGLRLNEHPEHTEGVVVFQHACQLGCEGIVSKRLGSTYRSGRSPDWLKLITSRLSRAISSCSGFIWPWPGAGQERPIIANGASGIRTTAMVKFHTGKAIDEEHVNKCHLNAAVFDSSWERQAAEILDKHDKVRAWVKNDWLGLAITYRKDGVARKYLPDFVVEMTDGSFLIVEIKGQEGDAAIKKAAGERWCKAVSNDGRFGGWAYSICWGPNDIMNVLNAH